MDKIERARQLYYELECGKQESIEIAVRNLEIKSRLAQKIQ